MKRLITLLLPALFAHSAFAQDLTGTWEGTEEGNYMKLVIVKVGNSYVGYTYDVDGGGGWCRANFAGSFDAKTRKVKGSGQGMIAMKGSHVQCVFNLNYSRAGNAERLVGNERTKGNDSFLDDLFGFDNGPVELRKTSPRVDTTPYMRRYIVDAGPPPPTRRSTPPVARTTVKAPAKPATARVTPPVTKAATPKPAPQTTTPKPTVKKPAPKPAAPVAKTRTVAPQSPAPQRSGTPVLPVPKPAATPADERLLTLKRERRSSLVQEIETTAPVITIRVYDNGVPDGDTVSILHNQSVVADHRLVAVDYFEFQVRLDEGDPVHDITLIAHNLGSIAPNTASLTIIAGEERYRLTASTDLGKNAVIRVRYKKPG